MLIRNLRRPGDYARAVIANNEQLRIEIANDNNLSRARDSLKKGILQVPTPEQEKDLSERIGDANQRRQRSIDNLRQVFTGDQVDRFLPLLDDDTFMFLNVYWKDMKADLMKRAETKLMDEFFFKSYLDRYMKTIMDQKGLNAPVGTQLSVNDPDEILSLFTWKDEGQKVAERMGKVDTEASRELRELLKLVPDKRRIERINSLPDADRQTTFQNLSNAFAGVETDPAKWSKALQQRDDLRFYEATMPLYRNMTKSQVKNAEDILEPLTLSEPKPKAKRGELPQAEAVEGEPEGEVAEARQVGQTDYMVPMEFDKEEVGSVSKQIRYIRLLKQTDILPDALKTRLFFNGETGKQNPLAFYAKPRQEGIANRQSFYAKLVTNDKAIKQAFKDREPQGSGMKLKPGRPKSGKGIASTCKEQTPRWIELGRYRVNGRLLDEKQLLSVRYQSGTAVPAFKKMIPISDAFHELLTNLFETKKLDKRLMKELDPEEQRSAEVLLVKSGVGRGFGIKEITPTNEEQKKITRFEVVKGSYLAGNNAPAVIHELRSLIIHFIESGHLNRKEGLRSLMELQ
jgi:hypothetical protein